MESKYYKNWNEIVETAKQQVNGFSNEKNIAAMEKKMTDSEEMIFNFCMGLLS